MTAWVGGVGEEQKAGRRTDLREQIAWGNEKIQTYNRHTYIRTSSLLD